MREELGTRVRSSLNQHVRPGALDSHGYAARSVTHLRQPNPWFLYYIYPRGVYIIKGIGLGFGLWVVASWWRITCRYSRLWFRQCTRCEQPRGYWSRGTTDSQSTRESGESRENQGETETGRALLAVKYEAGKRGRSLRQARVLIPAWRLYGEVRKLQPEESCHFLRR